jgi:deoxyadenosine/deoxycytidine kinase
MESPFGPHRYVIVEGPIGVGKTTLVRRLAERARARLVLEVFEENPFLASFYQDRARFAFQTELFFLLSRFHQQQGLQQQDLFSEVTLSDYIFTKNLIFSGLTLEDAEWGLYLDVYQALAPQILKPDLLVLLDAPQEILLERIARRGRSFEKGMDEAYLAELAARYRREFTGPQPFPVLYVDTTHLDIPSDDGAVDALIGEMGRTSASGRRFAG